MASIRTAGLTKSDLPGGRPHLRRSLIVLRVVANTTWSGLCVFTAAVLAGTASMIGLTHLVGEGVMYERR